MTCSALSHTVLTNQHATSCPQWIKPPPQSLPTANIVENIDRPVLEGYYLHQVNRLTNANVILFRLTKINEPGKVVHKITGNS